jgi:uncharacterized protein with GYD domain
MQKYMIQASYSSEGWKGVQKDKASGRQEAISHSIAALGGKLDALYFTLGEHDIVLIANLPDQESVAAFCIAASSAGVARTFTTALMTVEETDRALKKNVDYRPPGGKTHS